MVGELFETSELLNVSDAISYLGATLEDFSRKPTAPDSQLGSQTSIFLICQDEFEARSVEEGKWLIIQVGQLTDTRGEGC